MNLPRGRGRSARSEQKADQPQHRIGRKIGAKGGGWKGRSRKRGRKAGEPPLFPLSYVAQSLFRRLCPGIRVLNCSRKSGEAGLCREAGAAILYLRSSNPTDGHQGCAVAAGRTGVSDRAGSGAGAKAAPEHRVPLDGYVQEQKALNIDTDPGSGNPSDEEGYGRDAEADPQHFEEACAERLPPDDGDEEGEQTDDAGRDDQAAGERGIG